MSDQAMTLEEARTVAQRELLKLEQEAGMQLVLFRHFERPYGWVFTYVTKAFAEGDDSSRLAGNGPIYVRDNGEVAFVVPRAPIEDWIAELERSFAN